MTLERWSALLGLLGLGISLYLTLAHYASGQIPLACASGGVVNCELVTSSAESVIGPVPVALLGVVWFAVQLGLTKVNGPYQLAWAATGLAFIFYLVCVELFVIGALCLWCTAVHLIVVAQFLLAISKSTADVSEAIA